MLKIRLCSINMSKKMTLLGDFNIDYSNYNTLKTIQDYADTITSVGFEKIISHTPRDSPKRQSILDHVYVQGCMSNKVKTAAVIEHDLSDHFPIVLHLKGSILKCEKLRLIG